MMEIEPVTRKEMLMAAAAGESVVAPKPVTREEYFLSKISEENAQLNGNLVRLENLLIQIQDKLNQGTVVDNITVNEINNMIVEYFENKTVSEVEA